MGSDIYRYTVISIVGNVIVVRYESAQGSSLAPTDPQESSFAFWVCALAELDTGAFEWNDEMKRVAACALAAHNTWRDPTGDIIVKKNGGEPLTMDSIKEMMGEKLAGSYGTSGGQRGTTGSIGFRSVEDAQAFINDWDGKEHNNGIIHAYFKNVVDGPEWLSYYDIDHAKALEFIDNVELKETIRDEAVDGYLEEDENQPDLEPYWGTKAIYEITMSDAKYLEHLNEGDRWCGT
eukprot:m.126118 g.126118  ORF g.126118 m.126118 type:complete len:235 (+) comp17353_c0_seq3:175-879(+)